MRVEKKGGVNAAEQRVAFFLCSGEREVGLFFRPISFALKPERALWTNQAEHSRYVRSQGSDISGIIRVASATVSRKGVLSLKLSGRTGFGDLRAPRTP